MAEQISGLTPESAVEIDFSSDNSLFTRRLRHITSIQIRNLTPFPVRDAFTSALSQPTDTLHFPATATDDLNLHAGRRRPRRTSTNSVATRSSLKWEDGVTHDEDNLTSAGPTGTIRARKSSVNFVSGGDTDSLSPRTSSSKPQRPRASSRASSTTSSRILNFQTNTRVSSFLLDNSQTGLEKVITSRLLETCLVVSVIEHPPGTCNLELQPSSPKTAGLPPPSTSSGKVKSPPNSAPHTKSQFRSFPVSRQNSISSADIRKRSSSPEPPPSSTLSSSHPSPPLEQRKSRIVSANGRSKVMPAAQVKVRPKTSQLEDPVLKPLEATLLTYRSPIHRPSINPTFALTPGPISQTLEWTRLNAQSFRVAIWGKLPAGVQKANWDERLAPPYPDEAGFRWRVIQEWEVNLGELTPVPDDICDIPSNSLFLTLGPHGARYCIAPPKSPPSRPSSPTNGYASDPESELHKVKRASPEKTRPMGDDPHSSLRRRRRGANVSESSNTARTATWPDLFQLATLQALIYDNDASLSSISAKVDQLIAGDDLSPLKRGINERRHRISALRSHHRQVLDTCTQRNESIKERRAQLKQRRESLNLALQSVGDAEEAEMDIADRVDEERSQLASLHITMASMRASLISVLIDIFPIDLLSPADLLFTILGIALPLPSSPNDPAPPLSIPEHKDINEDTTASALGYVAQALQILAAYLGVNLLYPVTCIGSRSLIRDNISAMIGPRMFPLYSKGVDTYRFEYAVFLLNKNVEMLMVEKDLRALDMRHTLPNLKNLLLILSHDSARSEVPKSRAPDPSSSSLSLLSLDSENDVDAAVVTSGTSQARGASVDRTADGHTPPRSGATTPTPTPAIGESRSSRFLGFAPFTGFLRSRYPSTSRGSTRSSVHAGESADLGGDEGDDEDRSTIHGLARDVDRPKDEGSSEGTVGNAETLSEPKQHGGHAGITISATLSPETQF